MNEYKAFWKNYVNFNDRTTVKGYWMAILFNVILALVVSLVDSMMGMTILSSVFSLACFLPGIAITMRRLRDMGKKPIWILIGLVPLIGSIWLLILMCKPSIPADGTPVV